MIPSPQYISLSPIHCWSRERHGALDSCTDRCRSNNRHGRGSLCPGWHRLHLSWHRSRLLRCEHDVSCCSGQRRSSGSRKHSGCSSGSRCSWSVRSCYCSRGRCWRSSGGADCTPHMKIMNIYNCLCFGQMKETTENYISSFTKQ